MKNSYRISHTTKNYGKKYEKRYASKNYDAAVWKLEQEVLKKIILKTNTPTLMDFACGTGRILSVLENYCSKSIGVDVSEEMLKQARKKCKKSTLIKGDLTENTSLIKEKFDIITSFRFFLNAEKPLREKTVKELYKHLKKGGLFIFNIHGNKTSIRFFGRLIKKIFRKKVRGELSIKDMKVLLKKNNFKIKKVIGLSYMPKITYKVLPDKLWFWFEHILNKILPPKIGIDVIIICEK